MMGPVLGGFAKQKYPAGNTNFMFDGNSLVYGFGSTAGKTLPQQLQALPPANGTLVRNFGANGINITTMRSKAATSVDKIYSADKTNILFAWEATNTAWGSASLTGAQIGEQMAAYCAERLAVFPALKIILLTTIPRFSTDGSYGTNLAAGNATLIAYNDYIKANYRAMGAKMVVDVRASGVFEYTGPAMSAAMAPYVMDLIHCNDAGYGLVAQMCAAALLRLPAR